MDYLEYKQANGENLLVKMQDFSSAQYKVAGYLRLSMEDGDKDVSDSIVSQKSIIESKIKELGKDFELIDFYIDDGYTGLNTDRPAFQKMLKDIECKKINTVITKDLSRLSRNSFEANYFIELYFLERNIRYISILDNVDTYVNNSNNDMIQFKTLINDWYSKDISRKVKSGVWARKEKGLYLSARAPYGYSKSENNKNQLVINKEQAKIVKLIFEKFDNGEKQADIAKYLESNKVLAPSSYNDRGVFRKYIYKWDSAVYKILRNKVYLGHTEYGKRINLSYKSKKVKIVPRDEWKIVLNTHEPIISEELFERVQRKLEVHRKTKSQKFEWLLNGLVYCKECGSQMILKVEYTFVDMEVFKNFIWILIIMYFYQKLNVKSIKLDKFESDNKDKTYQEFVVISYARLKNKYGYLIKTDSMIEDLLYSFMIYETYQKSYNYKQILIDKIKNRNKRYGILNVETNNKVTDEESIVLVKEKLETKYKRIKKDKDIKDKLIKEKYKQKKELEEINKILDILKEFNK